jgi:hypothetical protein
MISPATQISAVLKVKAPVAGAEHLRMGENSGRLAKLMVLLLLRLRKMAKCSIWDVFHSEYTFHLARNPGI